MKPKTTVKETSQLPSNEQIIAAKTELSEFFKQVTNGTISIKSEKETVTSKLILLKDILEPLKESVEQKKLTYSAISKILEQKINLKVSTQTLRAFCQTQLGFEKAKSQPNNEPQKPPLTENNIPDNLKNYNAEQQLSQNKLNF